MSKSQTKRSSKWISMKWYIICIKITVIFQCKRNSTVFNVRAPLFSVLFVREIILMAIPMFSNILH